MRYALIFAITAVSAGCVQVYGPLEPGPSPCGPCGQSMASPPLPMSLGPAPVSLRVPRLERPRPLELEVEPEPMPVEKVKPGGARARKLFADATDQ